MGVVFLRVLNMSITASWLIVAVILLRFLLKKAPRWISCLLWAFVAVRLICPVSIESGLSLVPDKEPVSGFRSPVRHAPQDAPVMSAGGDEAGIENGDGMEAGMSDILSGGAASADARGVRLTGERDQRGLMDALGAVWVCGAAVMLIYSAVSYARLHKRTAASVVLEGRIWQSDEIATPFILGMIRPRIYLPSDLEEAQTEYVVAHERTHLKRHDHWWKPLGFFILSVHWFNPLCWVSYVLLSRDIELACDESVIRTRDEAYKKSYAEALFACSIAVRRVTACPLAFGEVGVKERVKNIMNYKKRGFWIVLTAAAACLIVAVCFLTDPQKKGELQAGTEGDAVAQNGEVIQAASDGNGRTAGDRAAGGAGNGNGRQDGGGTGGLDNQPDPAGAGVPGGDGMPGSDPEEVPGEVWEAAQEYVQAMFDQSKEDLEQGADWMNSYVAWRIEKLEYCYTYEQIAGMTCDIYRLNYEFLPEQGKDVTLVGGMSQSEDGWVVPESPDSNYLIFKREGGALSYFCCMYENDCAPGDELFTSDLNHYCLELDLFDESEGVHPNGEELIRRFREVDVEVLHTVPYTQDITGDYTGVGVDVTTEDGSTTRAEILCLGELPEYGIRVYGYNDERYVRQGVAVEIGENISYFDWEYMTPRLQFPKLYWNEEAGQLQLTLPIYTGTSFAAEKLVVLQYDEKGGVRAYSFGLEEFTALINARLGYRFDEESGTLAILDMRTDEAVAAFTLPDENVYGIWSGDISQFVLGDTILFRVTPGYLIDAAVPQYDHMPAVELEVEIIEDDGGLTFMLGELIR